ncbi:MAG: alanine/glycine:cation symporter family protein [Bacteroidota bacterium]
MKKSRFLLLLTALLAPLFSFAQEVGEKGIDEKINDFVAPAAAAIANVVFFPIPIGDGLSVPVVLIILVLGATYFTIYFGFPNFTQFKLAVNVVRGKFDNTKASASADLITKDGDIPDTIRVEGHHGEVTAFQALTAALSATVGLGNIAGVAIAIAVGGPGATFWMILAGLLGMASKFTECTLGVKYREIGPDGTVYGGPMYYLRKGLAEKGMAGLGKVFAVFYAIMLIGGSFGGGNMFQANQAAAQFQTLIGSQSGMAGTIFGVVVAALVGLVIIGGIKRIGKVAEKIVPFMVGIYVAAAVIILIANITAIPQAFGQIFSGAFSGAGITGGIIGVMIQGFRRAAFSNEAGVGSASVAHSAVMTRYPSSEGVVALLEPFIDTVVVCTMTALVIIIYNTGGHFDYGAVEGNSVILNDGGRLEGVNLTSAAFNSVLPGFSYVLTIAVILFAFSTMLSWSYYGLQAWKFLFGRSKVADTTYKILFCVFVVIGAAASLGAVVDFSDAMVFAMIFPNMIGLIILAPVVKDELKRYLVAINSGEINADDK